MFIGGEIMNNRQFPRDLSFQQFARLSAFIYATPLLDHQQFIAKWDVNRRLVAEICRADLRTVNGWFSQSQLHQSPKTYHLWYLTFADIILEQFDELPDFLQALLCPDEEP
jgi:hypothetical protein